MHRKIEALFRVFMMHVLSGKMSLYIANEYPKSGDTWIGQMLADVIGVSFLRNCLPKLESSIMHGHVVYLISIRNVVSDIL